MIFSATPQVMPSLDAKPGQTAQLVAKVMDMMGNPVPNQTVTFSMGAPTYTYPNSPDQRTNAPEHIGDHRCERYRHR